MRVEQVEILRLRAAPSAAQVKDQRIGVLERTFGDQVLELELYPPARIGPDMHIPDAGLVRGDDLCAVFKAAQEHFVRVKIGGRHAERDRRRAGRAPDLERHRRSHLAAKRVDGMERAIVRRYDLVAEKKAGLMRWRALDHPGEECAALVVGLGEHANSGIRNVPSRKHPLEPAMLERAGENVGELVIGRLLGRIVMGVGGAELGQHRIDDARRVLTGAGGRRLRPETRALFLPVEAVEAGIVEAIAHELPDLVEVGLI